MTENRCSDWDVPLSSLLPPSASRKRRRIRPPLPHHLFSELADDILVEILIRLPNPRSSCRCKSVCKRWRSLIADPSFNRRFISHHQTKNQPASLFIPGHDPEESILSFLPVPDKARPRFRAFDCFKDLVLCGFVNSYSELGKSFFLCNPFTKQWVALPLAPGKPVPHDGLAAGLVCQPRSNCKLVQQLGDEPEPEPSFVYSEYRFRVVCLFQNGCNQTILLFCSESGEWTQILMERHAKSPLVNAVTCNGKLYWEQTHLLANFVAYDPFRPCIPPELVLELECFSQGCFSHEQNISVSQGALHMILFDLESPRKYVIVWRLEEDGVHWTQQYKTVLKATTLCGYKLEHCYVLGLHPEQPESYFFQNNLESSAPCIFSCNLRNGMRGPELFSAGLFRREEPCWRALQPRVSCWPTPIPRYEQLRGMYDGSYGC
ncbi:unnamed protein product [Linum tenue]|uniref:F-box domain-containing protein n=1 Tax=Linum tenue TaxID=586396 RepID=A0AAV0P9Q5_9ROSI|nr:unnamed protein product [Linum tenue]